jgi:DNA polymerase-1
MKTLYLIDGHNVLYRTFYGVPRLTSPDGTPTNAVLGTARIILKILRQEDPGGIAAVFDTPEPTPRHVLFPEYKANRLSVPEDLAVQFPLVHEVVDALGVTRIAIPGAEADDVIGTLARQAEAAGMRVVVISSDKDLYQLVTPNVVIRDGLKEREVGEAQVRETFGVEPSQVVDLLALAGDPSDNVPGVPGIGEKTAAEMLREFGTLESLIANSGRLKGAKREKIEKNVEQARLCRRLTAIDREVALPVGPEGLAPRGIDAARVVPLFTKLGFRKLVDDLALGKQAAMPLFASGAEASAERPAAPASPPIPMRHADDAASVVAMLGTPVPGRVALYPGDGTGAPAALAAEGAEPIVFPAPALAAVLASFRGTATRLRVFDAKRILRMAGELPEGPDVAMIDLLVAGYLLSPDEGAPTPTKLFARYLPHGASAGEGGTPETRAAATADACLGLGAVLEAKLAEAGLSGVSDDVDMPLLPVLHRMERAGIRIDTSIFSRLSVELAEGTKAIEKRVADIAGGDFNVNSPKQLAFLLFEKLGLPPVKKTKTGYSTDVEVLEALKGAHEIPALVLEYRTLAKLKSTYVDVLPELVDPRDGRIHTTFNPAGSGTGRLSSTDPNLQNIPVRTELGQRIRRGFVPDAGNLFVGADYSQIELRLLAHLSGDVALVRAFREGADIHASTAASVFGVAPGDVTPDMRRKAKVINFGILYGMSAFGLSKELSIPPKEAKTLIDGYFERYAGVREYLEETRARARRDGFVSTILGRRRYIRDIGSQNRVLRDAAERMAINAPIQGSAADLIKVAMIRVDAEFRARGFGARLLLQVHDELLVEAPAGAAAEASAVLVEAMEGAAKLSVPLTVSSGTGANWGEVH